MIAALLLLLLLPSALGETSRAYCDPDTPIAVSMIAMPYAILPRLPSHLAAAVRGE